ncbi:MAG: TlpA family protein disulfide reductase [Pseudomonadota bacterium]
MQNKAVKRWSLAGTGLVALTLLSACSPASDVQTTTATEISWQQQNTTVINYFAEWCAPCLRELPELNEFYHQQVADNPQLQLIGVSFDPMSNQQIRALVGKHGIEFPLALAQPVPNFPFARPNMLPATYVVHPDGSVTGPLMGEQTVESLRQATTK